MIGHVFEIIDTIHLLDVVFTSIEQPSQVATFNFERKLFVLPDTAVLHFVKFIKLSLEENEVTARLAFGVHHGLFKFLEGVDNFEEAAMLEVQPSNGYHRSALSVPNHRADHGCCSVLEN